MFKLLSLDDLQAASTIIEECRIHLDTMKIPQWVPEYPNNENLYTDILKQEIYGYFDPFLKGIIVFHDRQDPEYQEVKWRFEEPVLTIHRLAVSPKQQKSGIASKLMDYAEHYALENNYKSIRLDAFSLNPDALRFYEKRGYLLSGVTFFKYRKHPFYCYEREINTRNGLFDKNPSLYLD